MPEAAGNGIAPGAGLVDEEMRVLDEVDILAEFDERELALFTYLDQAERLLPLGPFLGAVEGEHVSREWGGQYEAGDDCTSHWTSLVGDAQRAVLGIGSKFRAQV